MEHTIQGKNGELLAPKEVGGTPSKDEQQMAAKDVVANNPKASQGGEEPREDASISYRIESEQTQKIADTSGTNEDIVREEGQLAFETSMHWAPMKKSGHKKNLEALDSDEESENASEEEAGETSRMCQGDKRNHVEGGNQAPDTTMRDTDTGKLASAEGERASRCATVAKSGCQGAEPGHQGVVPSNHGAEPGSQGAMPGS